MQVGISSNISGKTPLAAFQYRESQVGTMALRHSFDNGSLPGSYANSACGGDATLHQNSVYSWVPGGSVKNGDQGCIDIISGALDAAITRWINSIPAGKIVYWAFAHEADSKLNKATAGTYTAAHITQAYQHVGTLINNMRTAGNAKAINQLIFTCILTTAYWAGSNPLSVGLLEDMQLAADMTTCDFYGQGTKAASGMRTYVAAMDARGARKGLTEFSTNSSQSTAGGKPQWIYDVIQYSYNNGYEVCVGFDSDVNHSEPLLLNQTDRDKFSSALATYGSGGGGGGGGGGQAADSATSRGGYVSYI